MSTVRKGSGSPGPGRSNPTSPRQPRGPGSTTRMQFSDSTDRWRVPHRKTGRESALARKTRLPALPICLGSLSRKKTDRKGVQPGDSGWVPDGLKRKTLETLILALRLRVASRSLLRGQRPLRAEGKALRTWPEKAPGPNRVTPWWGVGGVISPQRAPPRTRSFTHARRLPSSATIPRPHSSAYFLFFSFNIGAGGEEGSPALFQLRR